VISGYEEYIKRSKNPYDKKERKTVLTEAYNSEEMQIIIAEYPVKEISQNKSFLLL